MLYNIIVYSFMNYIVTIYNKSKHAPKYIPTYENAKLID